MEVVAKDFIAVKSFKAKGKRLTTYSIDTVTELEPVSVNEPDDDDAQSESAEVVDVEIEPERSDDEIRDELTGQQRLF